MCKEADDEPGEIIIVEEKDGSTHSMNVELLTIPDMAEAFEQCSKRPRTVIRRIRRINDDTSLSDSDKLEKAKKMLIGSITRAEVQRMGLERYSRRSKSNPGKFMYQFHAGFKRPVEDIYPVKSYDDVEELRIHPQEKTTLWIYEKLICYNKLKSHRYNTKMEPIGIAGVAFPWSGFIAVVVIGIAVMGTSSYSHYYDKQDEYESREET